MQFLAMKMTNPVLIFITAAIKHIWISNIETEIKSNRNMPSEVPIWRCMNLKQENNRFSFKFKFNRHNRKTKQFWQTMFDCFSKPKFVVFLNSVPKWTMYLHLLGYIQRSRSSIESRIWTTTPFQYGYGITRARTFAHQSLYIFKHIWWQSQMVFIRVANWIVCRKRSIKPPVLLLKMTFHFFSYRKCVSFIS